MMLSNFSCVFYIFSFDKMLVQNFAYFLLGCFLIEFCEFSLYFFYQIYASKIFSSTLFFKFWWSPCVNLFKDHDFGVLAKTYLPKLRSQRSLPFFCRSFCFRFYTKFYYSLWVNFYVWIKICTLYVQIFIYSSTIFEKMFFLHKTIFAPLREISCYFCMGQCLESPYCSTIFFLPQYHTVL